MPSYYNILDYIPYVILFIPETNLSYNWKSVPLPPLHLFAQPHSPLPYSNLQFRTTNFLNPLSRALI